MYEPAAGLFKIQGKVLPEKYDGAGAGAFVAEGDADGDREGWECSRPLSHDGAHEAWLFPSESGPALWVRWLKP
jgi:hypothetical protein